ncbi:hypothetical protein [Mobilicoccus caccae]|uniref:Uncharacterized protein n=1 Tax=Mobilicoccus caccae TaxID=1859295 RepID=A0ABQ6IXW7_9MICO|nr:hypothetical protein [Mobilicoccus caccae]GMA41534.1 hypothetical protein GCM10025883_35790 [Mobilicoccus caccae]
MLLAILFFAVTLLVLGALNSRRHTGPAYFLANGPEQMIHTGYPSVQTLR